MKTLLLSLFTLGIMTSCGSSSTETEETDVYEKVTVAFVDNNSESEVKSLIEPVMTRYGMEITDENILRVGNMLVELRKASAVGVTEMEILKDMYQNGSDNISMAEQAGLSATKLELKK